MSTSSITLSITDRIARLALNRPDRLNSLDGPAMVELAEALREVEANTDARVLVLTGVGRAFCAGQDLSDPAMSGVGGEPPDVGAIVERHYKPVVLQLRNLRVPTIAAVNGLAAGAGAALALACDIVVAAKSAYFLQAFAKIGLTPDTGTTWFLTHQVGTARAIGLTYLADRLPAATAAEWGLIWQAVDDDAFAERVDALAAQLAAAPTRALVETRRLVEAAWPHTLDEQLSMEADTIGAMGRSADHAEGVAAFHEKRPPRFTGS